MPNSVNSSILFLVFVGFLLFQKSSFFRVNQTLVSSTILSDFIVLKVIVDDLKLVFIMIGKYHHCVTVIVDYMNPFFHEYFEGKSTEKYYKGQTHFKNMFFKGKIPEKHSCDIKKRLSIIVFIVPFVE